MTQTSYNAQRLTLTRGVGTKRELIMDTSSLRFARAARGISPLAVGLCVALLSLAIASAQADEAVRIAVLSTELQNDHAQWAPTTDAERQRLMKIEETFKSMLEASGKYKFATVSPTTQERIKNAQKMGRCGGCEIQYGKELGVSQVAWIEVQKVSELILNINVYIASVDAGQLSFVKSVDLRGNTDESWQHSIKFLVKRYILHSDESQQK
jgi:uncharacterized protein DUF2380